jgi:prevent-host-death family protein
MAAKTVDAGEARARLDELIDFVREGNEVTISEKDRPVARLAPVGRKRRIAGLTRGKVYMTPDFDDPLPDSFWLGEE